MNGPEDTSPSARRQLLESLRRDADREASEIMAKARAEADRLIADAEELNREVLRDTLGMAERDVAPSIAQILNQARGEARKAILRSQYRVLQEAFDGIPAFLDGADRPEILRGAFPSLLGEALEGLPGDLPLRVSFHPEDEGRAREILAGHSGPCQVEAVQAILGGARVETGDGREIRDNTVEGRLRNLREAPPVELLARVFPPSPPSGGPDEEPEG